MRWTRRTFLQTGVAAGAACGLSGWLGRPPFVAAAPGSYRPAKAEQSLELLILGGTAFLGPATVEAALARGHRITLFNRGKTNPHLFPELEKLVGDRDGDLAALADRRWDAVIDTSGYVPRVVGLSARLLAPNVDHYVFISSISVYADFSRPGMDETAVVGTLADPTREEITGETYGPLKALCEKAAEAAMPGRVANIRPGLIVGPLDRTDRFTYWPVRLARGGEVLAPGSGDDLVQFIDVRDLGEWLVMVVEQRITGVFNADSPADSLTMRQCLESCRDVSRSDAQLTWVDTEFLAEQEVAAWSEMPIWVPADGEYAGFGRISTAKAMAAGLGQRPLATTVGDTLNWWREQPAERRQELRAGIAPEKEAAVLRAWHQRG